MTDAKNKPATSAPVNPNVKLIADIIKTELGAIRAEMYEEQERKAGEQVERKNVPEHVSAGSDFSGRADSILPRPKNTKGLNMARWLKYMWRSGGNPEVARKLAQQAGDHVVAKAVGESQLSGGGAAVPPEFAAEVIEELGARSILLKQNVTVSDMRGSLILPFIDTSTTASWVGENSNTTSTQPSFGQIVLRDHLLSVVVPASNTWLKNASSNSDALLRDHMLRQAKRKLDATLIRSFGTQNEPQGLLGMVDSANKTHSNGTVNLANVTTDLTTMIQNILNQNVDLDQGGAWLFSPRTWSYLMAVRGAQDYYAFRDEMTRGTLLGFKFDYSTNIPINLADHTGSGSTFSEVYFAHFPTLVFALGEDFRVETFRGGSYYDGTAVQSGIAQDQTVFQLILSCDFASMYRGKDISYMDDVKWGT